MCYSPESSAGTFLFVAAICIFLWKRGGPLRHALAVILLFIALMQVVEFFLWLNTDCTQTNKNITYAIPVLLFLQPVIVLGSLLYFNVGLLPSIIYKVLLGIWIASLPLFIIWMKSGFNKCTKVGQNGHLVWPSTIENSVEQEWAQGIYNFMLVAGIGTLKTEWYGMFYVLMASIGYFQTKQIYGHSWASVWCNFVNILALGALFVK